MQLPILYRKTETDAIQFWKVISGATGEGFGFVETTYGQLGTDKPQITTDIVKEGKNAGKKNATTAVEQAHLQAKQHFDKKVKQGYVEDLEAAKRGESKLEAIKPMLAQVFEDREHEIKYPCVIQPKLDGMRCVSICRGGKVSLYSRTQKPINTVPHIVEQLEKLTTLLGQDWILDGELYNHSHKDNFNELMSILKRDELHPKHTLIEYHIYDVPSESDLDTVDRMNIVLDAAERCFNLSLDNLIPVSTSMAFSREEIDSKMSAFIAEGYEGAMVRTDGPYEFKRSKHLLKYKTFKDDEFEIVGVEEGSGKLMGHAGSFICVTKDGRTFNAKMTGKLDNLKEMFENFEDKYLGKMLTVKFFDYTPDRVPRFPVGMRIRIEE